MANYSASGKYHSGVMPACSLIASLNGCNNTPRNLFLTIEWNMLMGSCCCRSQAYLDWRRLWRRRTVTKTLQRKTNWYPTNSKQSTGIGTHVNHFRAAPTCPTSCSTLWSKMWTDTSSPEFTNFYKQELANDFGIS